jgi:hypothetical protein
MEPHAWSVKLSCLIVEHGVHSTYRRRCEVSRMLICECGESIRVGVVGWSGPNVFENSVEALRENACIVVPLLSMKH